MFSFAKTPAQNIAYITSLEPKVMSSMSFSAHKRAFVISKITNLELLQDIKTLLLKNQIEHKGFNDFKKDIQELFIKKGYSMLNPYRLKLIYTQNIRQAVASTEAQKLYNNKSIEYLRYIAILDSRTRIAHTRAHNTILPKEHDFWRENYPPNGFNCRCVVRGYSKEELEKRALKPSNPPKTPPHDKGFNTDNRDLDNNLRDLLTQKIKKYEGTTQEEYLKGLMGWIDEQDNGYKKTLNLYNAVLNKEIDKKAQKEKITDEHQIKEMKNQRRIAISHISEDLRHSIPIESTISKIYLSYSTLEEHIKSHPDVNAFDYYLSLHLAESPLTAKRNKGESSILFFKKLGFWYRAAFKATKDGKECFLTSLVKRSYPFKEMRHLPQCLR